jgi:hypothetical protein
MKYMVLNHLKVFLLWRSFQVILHFQGAECVNLTGTAFLTLLYAGLQTNNGPSSGTVNCPICNELVAGRRFAPHLEKCMNGGKRGSKRHYDYLHDEPSSKVSLKPKVEVVEQVDPHPKSLVVRIKLRNGGELLFLSVILTTNKFILAMTIFSSKSESEAHGGDLGRLSVWCCRSFTGDFVHYCCNYWG